MNFCTVYFCPYIDFCYLYHFFKLDLLLDPFIGVIYIVRSPDGPIVFFGIFLPRDTLAPYMLIIGQYDVLCTSIDLMKENSFAQKRSRLYPTKNKTDADYADDQTLIANKPAQVKS